jgi:hypothetical protein
LVSVVIVEPHIGIGEDYCRISISSAKGLRILGKTLGQAEADYLDGSTWMQS